MDTLISFIAGLFLGGTLTMVVMSLCIASSKRDKLDELYDSLKNNDTTNDNMECLQDNLRE